MSKLQLTCPDAKPVENFFHKKDFLIHASGFRSESHRKFGEHFQAWLSKLNSMCLEDFSGGNFFWYKNNSVTLLVIWQIFCQTFDNIFLAVFSHYPPRCPEELIEDRVEGFFWGQISFWALSKIIIWTLSLKLGHGFQHCIRNLLRNVLVTIFFKKRITFDLFSEIDRILSRISSISFRHGWENCILLFYMKTLWNERFSWKDIFSLMLHDFGQIISILCVKTLGPSCQKCFQRVGKSLLKSFLQEVPVF